MPDGALVAYVATTLLVGVAVWLLLQSFVLGALWHGRAQQELYADLRLALAAQTAPVGGDIAPQTPVALLEIPTLGLQQVVVEGSAPGDTLTALGHRRNTVLPGQEGTSVVVGRSTTFGAPLREAPHLQPGDGVVVTTAQGEFTFRVDRVRRAGDPLPAARQAGAARLTLVTTEPVGDTPLPLSGLRTVWVESTLVGEAVTGAGHVAQVPATEDEMGTDPTGLPLLVIWLGVLLAVAAGVVLAARRLPRRTVLMLALPVVAVLLWLAGECVVRLLPNLV